MPSSARPLANYLEMPARLPPAFWWTFRIATLAGTLALMALIVMQPRAGLDVFWKLVVPGLPLVFAVIPGLWRQVCPMALLNQLPQRWGISRNLNLPMFAKNGAYIVSTLVFFFVVSLRHVYFNTDPTALMVLMAASLVIAFAGGLVFKGRSGWCGTLCPLAPIQKAYGLAPVVVVRNGYCPKCVGCQKNCYDFNPRAAMFSDLSDSDPWYAGHREFFIAGLPGLAIGFYTSADANTTGLLPYFLYMGQCIAVTLGVFMAITRIVRISRYKSALFFSMSTLAIFYWYASPVMTGAITEFTGIPFPGPLSNIFFFAAAVAGGLIVRNGLLTEDLLERHSAPHEPHMAAELDALRAAGAEATAGAMVIDRGTGRSFAADPGRSLLEGLESAGVKIDYGCRMGICGADPIVVVGGAGALSAPSQTERETLQRLGVAGQVRLACVCRAESGGVTIDTKCDPHILPAQVPAAVIDPAIQTGIRRVVIVGNGAAATAAAEEIRRLSPSCSIDMIAREAEHYYNRMAIARLLYGRTAMDGITLHGHDWGERKNVTVWLNTSATMIDRGRHEVLLGTGEKLPYDKLVLAPGGRAVMPSLPGSTLPGCFVLREAADAMAIRAWRQEHDCRNAVVLGGGVLGVEAADALRQLNLKVTILHRTDRLMDRQLNPAGSAILKRYLEGLGITVICAAGVERCRGDGRLSATVLADGMEIETDILVACAGIQPNIELARHAGLAVGRGVKVDQSMRTSDPDIFAAGDAAELPRSAGGLWPVSAAQGRAAGGAVFGGETTYVEPNTSVSLKVDGIDVKSFGVVVPAGPHHEVILDPGVTDNEHRMIIIENGGLVGAVAVGPPGAGKQVAELIERRPDLSAVLDDLRRGEWSALARSYSAA